MAVTKLWKVESRLDTVIDYVNNPQKTTDMKALQDVVAYAENEEKTEKRLFCTGVNCNPLDARNEFMQTKIQFNKLDGIQAWHGYMSFEEQNITPEEAEAITLEFVKEVWGDRFQVVVTTHLNTKHLHCHYVVNSVSFVDGKRAHDETSWFRFAPIADRICQAHGLSIVKKPERNTASRRNEDIYDKDAPTPWKLARIAIDEAISKSTTVPQMQARLKGMGYTFDFNERHKYWTIVPKGSKKSIRLYRLGESYTTEAIKARLYENKREYWSGGKQNKVRPKAPRHKCLSTYQRIMLTSYKLSGLNGLYLHYLHLLGRLPPRRKSSPTRVHYSIRDDLIKLNQITAQSRLLYYNHIETYEDLKSYKDSCADKLQQLYDKRQKLRNAVRSSKLDEVQKATLHQEISDISKEMGAIRKDIRTCEQIEEKSEEIKYKTELAKEKAQQRQFSR